MPVYPASMPVVRKVRYETRDTKYVIRDTLSEPRVPSPAIRILITLLCLFLGSSILVARSANTALVLTVKDAIGPATSDFIHNGLNQARERNASLVVLRLDTPGGLDTSMRDIIRDILASPVPVVTYVSPPGSRTPSGTGCPETTSSTRAAR